MTTTVAEVALILWAPISLVAFASLRPQLACIFVLLGAFMFLPERFAFDFAGLPPLDKQSLPALYALIGALLYCRPRLRSAQAGRGIDIIVVILICSGIVTAQTNSDGLIYGPRRLASLSSYDGISMAARDLLRFGIPFFLGRALFRTSRDLRDLMWCLAFGGLIYSILCLVEIRLSPQLHIWTYGYHQHAFAQTRRFGGFRPTVFMGHGLAVALFMLTSTLAVSTLGRVGTRFFQIHARTLSLYSAAVLIACKSLAAIAYGFFLVPATAMLKSRTQIRIACALIALVCAYPMLRITNTFPTESLVDISGYIDEARARSLDFRFQNETDLVDKLLERFWFGWGGYGRNRVWNPLTGYNMTTLDGMWIILATSRGIVGLTANFALLVAPVVLATRRFRRLPDHRDRLLIAGLSLIIAILSIDLLPNGLFTNLPYFLSGALWGLVQALSWTKQKNRQPGQSASASRGELERQGPPPRAVRGAANESLTPVISRTSTLTWPDTPRGNG